MGAAALSPNRCKGDGMATQLTTKQAREPVEIPYEVVRFDSEDAAYAIVLWELPDRTCRMEIWDIAANMCIDPGAATLKKVSAQGKRIVCKSRDKALSVAGVLIAERDQER
jgi:hypothetical protein